MTRADRVSAKRTIYIHEKYDIEKLSDRQNASKFTFASSVCMRAAIDWSNSSNL